MNPKQNERLLLSAFILVVGLIALTRFTSLKPHWGSLEVGSTATITVTGQAQKEQTNQIATFTAGVESIESTKEEALNKTNEAMNQLIAKVKAFGIKDEDIETQTVNVYQNTEAVSPDMATIDSASINIEPDGKAQKGDWWANNSVTIKLREVDRAEALLALINESGVNYVYGPNFSLDDSSTLGDELLPEAVNNAREKANSIANANNQKVGKIISLTEGSNSYPIYSARDQMLAATSKTSEAIVNPELEVGSSKISKSVTVTFELN
ncbi:MAG TPA: SIMPL domain-containing protein [Candidatus Woesebacteria bacterium]|nr:SIMPL domain-containing protein [Candidatus Woesebacteria bacterium]